MGGAAARPLGASLCDAATPAAEAVLDAVAADVELSAAALPVFRISSLKEAEVVKALMCCTLLELSTASDAAVLTEPCPVLPASAAVEQIILLVLLSVAGCHVRIRVKA